MFGAFILLLTLFSFFDFKLFSWQVCALNRPHSECCQKNRRASPRRASLSGVRLSLWCTGAHVAVLVLVMIGTRFA